MQEKLMNGCLRNVRSWLLMVVLVALLVPQFGCDDALREIADFFDNVSDRVDDFADDVDDDDDFGDELDDFFDDIEDIFD